MKNEVDALLFGIEEPEDPKTLEKEPNRDAEEFISVLHRVHCDNSELQYYAERLGGGKVSIMPLTPFVYEFFLFNSLYEVDWMASNLASTLVPHPESFKESQKQRAFIKYVKPHASKKPADFYRAFEPLIHIDLTEGEWSRVTPDSRITITDGEKFFRDIRKFQTLLRECKTPQNLNSGKSTFKIMDDCTYYINKVRNNIFHGSKTLGDVYEPNQKRRIEVYDLFLKGLTSLFFLASGKDTAACDLVPCPIFSSSLPTRNPGEVMDQSVILGATAQRLMKVGDSRLVARFTKILPPPALKIMPGPKSCLFYPSAGTDFLTPILLGLPYCTQFYFFERSRQFGPPEIAHILLGIKGVQIPGSQSHWKSTGDKGYFDFEFNDIPRRLHWVHADNTAILQEEAELKFYFHRGDSWGEGGSGQEWDSKLLPELLKMVPPNSSCICLTDGVPGGFEKYQFSEVFELNMPFIGLGRTYYCGKLSSMHAVA